MRLVKIPVCRSILHQLLQTMSKRQLKTYPDSASSGIDCINAKMLKLSAYSIASSLSVIFNSSIEQSIFPDVWKCDVATLIFKKGDIYNMSNYRPISLLPLVSKCFEKIVAKQLPDYLVYFSDIQHGFHSKRSSETALLRLTNLLFRAKQRKQYSCLVTIDFSRAFDCINYNQLLGAL